MNDKKMMELYWKIKEDWMSDVPEVEMSYAGNGLTYWLLNVGDEDWLVIAKKDNENIVKIYTFEMWSLVIEEIIEKTEPDKIIKLD